MDEKLKGERLPTSATKKDFILDNAYLIEGHEQDPPELLLHEESINMNVVATLVAQADLQALDDLFRYSLPKMINFFSMKKLPLTGQEECTSDVISRVVENLLMELKRQDKSLIQLSVLGSFHELAVVQHEDISSIASLATIDANIFETMAEITILVLPAYIRQMLLRHLSICTDVDAYEQLKDAFERRGILLETYQQEALSSSYQKDKSATLFLSVYEYIKEKTGTFSMEENQYAYIEETLEKANDMLKQIPDSEEIYQMKREQSPLSCVSWMIFQRNIPHIHFEDRLWKNMISTFFNNQEEERQAVGPIKSVFEELKSEEEDEWQLDPVLVDLSEQLRASSSLAINPHFEARLRAKLLHMMETHKTLQEEREIEKETPITNVEEIILTQLSGLSSDIVELPRKQRQAFLVDLAHRLPGTKDREPLEQALLEEGIGLQKYQERHFIEDLNSLIDGREQRQLLFSAYRKMARLFKKFYLPQSKNKSHIHFV